MLSAIFTISFISSPESSAPVGLFGLVNRIAFVLLSAAADTLSQHKNTIRYRLDKIHELTGLDYKNFSQLEQLSMALKILQCSMP